MYIVMVLKKDMVVDAFGVQQRISFESAGFIGMLPVFEKREDAEDWGAGSQIVEIKTMGVESNPDYSERHKAKRARGE